MKRLISYVKTERNGENKVLVYSLKRCSFFNGIYWENTTQQ